MNHAVAVMKMHLVDRLTLIALPLGILVSSFLINLVIWLPLSRDGRHTGGALSVLVFVLAAAVFAVVRGLPFALGMGASRRAFAVGTTLTGAVLSLGFGTLYLVLGEIERASGGWGLGGAFFDFGWLERSSWPARWLMLVVAFLAAWLIGTALAALWPRWGMHALVVGGPLVVVLAGGAVALLTWRQWWDSVGSWLGGLTPLTATAWLVLLAAASAAATWASLRRTSCP